MKLRLERQVCGPVCTIGELSIDGAFECYTLEDAQREIPGKPVAEWKVKNETAVSKGTYDLEITKSKRFSAEASKKAGHPVDIFTPELMNVPGFDGIRIHPGNTAENTEGCILVGRGKTEKTVTESRAAFNALFPKIQQGLQDGDHVTIEVT